MFSCNLVSFLVPHEETGWFNLCVSHVILSEAVDPFLAASVWEPMKAGAWHTGNGQQRSCFTVVFLNLNSHTVAGRLRTLLLIIGVLSSGK